MAAASSSTRRLSAPFRIATHAWGNDCAADGEGVESGFFLAMTGSCAGAAVCSCSHRAQRPAVSGGRYPTTGKLTHTGPCSGNEAVPEGDTPRAPTRVIAAPDTARDHPRYAHRPFAEEYPVRSTHGECCMPPAVRKGVQAPAAPAPAAAPLTSAPLDSRGSPARQQAAAVRDGEVL